MATQLLGRREFRTEQESEEGSPTRDPVCFRSLSLQARGSDLCSGSLLPNSESIQVHVFIIQRDCLRIITASDPSTSQPAPTTTAMDEEVQPVGRWFSLEVSDHLVEPVEWEEVVLEMIMGFNLFPEVHRRMRQELPTFLDEMAKEARDRGFGALAVTAQVEQLVAVVQTSDEEVTSSAPMLGSGDEEESRFFLAVMACRPIRNVQFEAGEMCVICQDEFTDGTEISQLCCSHVFHSGCISRWLQISSRLQHGFRCPNCRYNLLI